MTFISIGEGKWHVESAAWAQTGKTLCGRNTPSPAYCATRLIHLLAVTALCLGVTE